MFLNFKIFGTWNIRFLEELLKKMMTLMTTEMKQEGSG